MKKSNSYCSGCNRDICNCLFLNRVPIRWGGVARSWPSAAVHLYKGGAVRWDVGGGVLAEAGGGGSRPQGD